MLEEDQSQKSETKFVIFPHFLPSGIQMSF